ncbi:MAG: hypothetical protein KIS78_05765 [Labilithrix sp.]|nr:hypothetical protein [Labilithrix sp.]MCW5831943.1 hypothetical protein [Labilithrix sp.]
MRRPAALFGLAGLLAVAYLAARVAGWAEHTSAICGMPRSPASWTLGPVFVVLYLAFVVLAPVLAIAATLDTLLLLRRR